MKDFKINIHQNTKEKSTEVSLSGQLNITNINAIHDELKKISGIKTINMKIDEIEDIDIPFLQTIEAFKVKCAANNIQFNLSANVNEDLNLLITRAGLQHIM